ncbi:MAG: bifunctional glutamate N-acetyltransferase/amino-acid acetyltransferase ArgJ [Porticoccaceae bacterium]|nr:bifunctional glutamate N-acetyltransferase/amino-acid acetyltransferase ArgJ [Porticoccaceae bacterium]
MAVGENTFSTLPAVAGFRLGTASAGIKTPGRKDLVVMECAAGSSVAGVFTRNAFCAAPVQIAKAHLAQLSPEHASDAEFVNTPCYFVINTGNANAGTGAQGYADALAVCESVAELAGVEVNKVLPFSTGVIGEPLAVRTLTQGLPAAMGKLDEDGWRDAAEGILTTDTRPKGAFRQFDIEGKQVTVTGICKGSGMIKPNMATMLGFVATDADVPQVLLQQYLVEALECSFNRITVDGDTSTNDSLMLAATGQAGVTVDAESDSAVLLRSAIIEVCEELAQAIVRDGEGATKFVTIKVAGGLSSQECLDVAYTVAESPLVKTALFASDPNWGRILAAIGRAGIADLDADKVKVWLGEVLIAEREGRAASYTEAAGQAVMDEEEITIHIDLGRAASAGEKGVTETIWTTDLSYDYIRINAEYRS